MGSTFYEGPGLGLGLRLIFKARDRPGIDFLGLHPSLMMADPKYLRAWPEGCGFIEIESNYAPTISLSELAKKFKCHQVLWLHGPEMEITEVGPMNFFAFFQHNNGKKNW